MKTISEMTDRELLEYLAGEVASLGTRVDSLDTRMDSLDTRMDSLDTRMDSLDTRITEIGVAQENIVIPAIQALTEGHAAIMEKLDALTPKSRVEELEDKVSMLQLAIRGMARDLDELKKAQ